MIEQKNESNQLNEEDQSPKLKSLRRTSKIQEIRQAFKLSLEPCSNINIKWHVINPLNGSVSPFNQNLSAQFEDTQQTCLFQQKYEVEGKLGQGCFGFVKKCRSKNNDKLYAVKFMMLNQQHYFFLRKNFYAIRCLKHPNVITYKSLHLDKKNNKCQLVMEYAEGYNLKDMAIQNEDELKKIMYKIFSALVYIHKMQICHRDIKPQNIIYDGITDTLKIVDFGISRRTRIRGEKCRLLTSTGTLNYKAPQIFMGIGYDQSVDVWSAGITLYELVAGYTPFQSYYKSDTINKIIKCQPQFDERWDKYSKFLKNLVIRILKHRKDRYTAAQVLQDIWFSSQSAQSSQLQDKHQSLRINIKNQHINCLHLNSMQAQGDRPLKHKAKKIDIKFQDSDQQGIIEKS